jgi:hypothetical protein
MSEVLRYYEAWEKTARDEASRLATLTLDENDKLTDLKHEAIDKAVADTLGKGYLKEYLERKEFITMITKVLTIEEEIELIRKDERAEGKAEEKIEIAKTSIRAGLPKRTGIWLSRFSKLLLSQRIRWCKINLENKCVFIYDLNYG